MDSSFAQDLLLSMPPLESKDFSLVQSDLVKLVDGNSSSDLDQDALAKDMKARTCEDESSNSANDPFAAALEKCVKEHQEATYGKKDGVTSRCTVVQQEAGDGDGGDESSKCWMLKTYAEVLNTAKFRTGYWAGKWMIGIDGEGEGDDDGGNSTIKVTSGELSLHVYYYEGDLNVQMRGKREISNPKTIKTGDNDDDDDDETNKKAAKAIVDYISSMEKALHQDLSEDNDNALYLSSLKRIRRILPITKTRMKWDVAAQNEVRLLNARSSKN